MLYNASHSQILTNKVPVHPQSMQLIFYRVSGRDYRRRRRWYRFEGVVFIHNSCGFMISASTSVGPFANVKINCFEFRHVYDNSFFGFDCLVNLAPTVFTALFWLERAVFVEAWFPLEITGDHKVSNSCL